jgi:hypothetical protein
LSWFERHVYWRDRYFANQYIQNRRPETIYLSDRIKLLGPA